MSTAMTVNKNKIVLALVKLLPNSAVYASILFSECWVNGALKSFATWCNNKMHKFTQVSKEVLWVYTNYIEYVNMYSNWPSTGLQLGGKSKKLNLAGFEPASFAYVASKITS